MRRAAKVDINQSVIVAALRQLGASVQPLHILGGGAPDLLIGWRGQNLLIEVKNGNKSPSRRRLTVAESEWQYNWHGQVAIISTVDDAITFIINKADRHG